MGYSRRCAALGAADAASVTERVLLTDEVRGKLSSGDRPRLGD